MSPLARKPRPGGGRTSPSGGPREIPAGADPTADPTAGRVQAGRVQVGPVQVGPVQVGPVPVDPVRAAADRGESSRRVRHRARPSLRRRPELVLAAALVGAGSLALATVPGYSAVAHAAGGGGAVGVARELGLASSARRLSRDDATARLGDLAASRSQRQAEQAAAARAQAAADAAARARAAADDAARAAAAEAARPRAVLPVAGATFTSGFGMRWGTLHAGIDLAAPLGTPEYAAMDGVVLRAGPASGFGQAVYIQHANGDVTVYGHMEKLLVHDGQQVRAGDTIALMGAEGEATGSHLHFEVHAGGIEGPRIDPVPWLRERGVQV